MYAFVEDKFINNIFYYAILISVRRDYMTSSNTYGLRVVINFIIVLLLMLLCSFVANFKYIDLLYMITAIIFVIKLLRMEK